MMLTGANGHPGAAVVPAALAVATQEANGIDLLTVVVVGYEVAVRGGMSENQRSYHSGNYTGLGAAAATARTRGLTAAQ